MPRSSRFALLIAISAGFVAAALLLVDRNSSDHHAVARITAPAPPGQACSKTVASPAAVQAALSDAAPGTTICLGDGSYGELDLAAATSAPGVVIRAEHPGRTTIEGVELSGANLTLARFAVRGEVTIAPGSRRISIVANRITGGYMGINAGPTTSTAITDTTIRGNKLVGPFGEDALRINRYHDSADPDPYGILIEGNEITGVRENGNHSDCLQSVWGGDGLYFVRNYLHDNRCQGFFVKDQPQAVSRIVVANNLMLRDSAPCAPPSADCGPPSIVQIFGPASGVKLRDNTIWTSISGSPTVLREGPFGRVRLDGNVIYRGWSDWRGGFPNFAAPRNIVCQWEGTLPPLGRSSRRDCTPGFRDIARDDYRLRSGSAGIDWSPAEQRYGPAAR